MANFYLIGLTGNLGCGKSTVRRMLEQLGARGIDADLLAHTVMKPGTTAWDSIVDTFGLDIVRSNGEIDRQKLGARVFGDPDALRRLEEIVHPAVGALVKEILRENETPVVVLEAVKLVEAGMHRWCDAVWVVTCSADVQIQRVVRDRQMRVEDARARLASQTAQDEKMRVANVVIDNSRDLTMTQFQVQNAWTNTIRLERARDKGEWLSDGQPNAPPQESENPPPVAAPQPPPAPPPEPPASRAERAAHPAPAETGRDAAVQVRRARRSDLAALGTALTKREGLGEPLSRAQVLERFGDRGYRIAITEDQIVALAALEIENLVAVTRDLWVESSEAAARSLPKLLALIEQDARELLCEVSAILIEETASVAVTDQARQMGYESRELSLLNKVWREVVGERVQPGQQVWVKRLRDSLVTQPV